MKLFNSAANEIVDFDLKPVVTIYTCGITPYDSTHIGHAAVFLTFDLLQRRLRSLGSETRLVRNITDIDDDILKKAAEREMDYRDLVNSEVAKFNGDLLALNVLPSWSEPMATSAIAEIITFTQKALSSGHAYEVDGTVFFNVSSWPDFGELSGYSQEEMLLIAAERGGFPDDDRKHNPLDFVLWQAKAEGEPSWESPWGDGRPGWHIECSVLAQRELGETIDIHGGGSDLVFPHHECELAQTKAVTGGRFVDVWMHQAMVRMDGEKMSKSLGNMEFISDLRKDHDPRAIRIAITRNHYRSEWDWTSDTLTNAQNCLEIWNKSIGGTPGGELLEQVGQALDNDLDTPLVFELIDDAAKAGVDVTAAAELIGVELG